MTHAPDANDEKGLTKTPKNNRKTQIFNKCTRRKNAMKNNAESRFPCSVIKNSLMRQILIPVSSSKKQSKNRTTMSGAPNPNHHGLVKKKLSRLDLSWQSKNRTTMSGAPNPNHQGLVKKKLSRLDLSWLPDVELARRKSIVAHEHEKLIHLKPPSLAKATRCPLPGLGLP